MTAHQRIWPVILSGGSGTRLWPLSRTLNPKQLLPLAGHATMIQETVARVQDSDRFHAPLIVGNRLHQDAIVAQLAAAGVTPSAMILEPAARNTAPAIAIAALHLAQQDPQALMLVMPSDQLIADPQAFRNAVAAAIPIVADDGWMATFGITPTGPETGYGYIRMGKALADGVSTVERFVEKPDLATARGYLAEGCYAWNGGIFLLRADTYLAELERHAPLMAQQCRAAMAAAGIEGSAIVPEAQAFAASPSDSIDYAVMEKAERVAVVPVDMGWSDIGSWDALWQVLPHDSEGNARVGDTVVHDARGCLLRSDGPLITAIGIEDLAVIATDDAVTVMPRARAQEVKTIVEALKAADRVELHKPVREAGSWGETRSGLAGSAGALFEHRIAPGGSRLLPPAARDLIVLDGAGAADSEPLAEGSRLSRDAGPCRLTAAAAAPLLVVEIRRG